MIIPNEFKELNSIVKNRQSFFRLTIAERLVRKGELIEFNKMIESKWLECATSYLELTIEIRNEIRKKTPTNKYKILFNKLESKILPSENINQNQVDSVYGDLVILKSLTEISREFNVGISSLADHLELNEIIIESSPNTKVPTDAYKILLKKFGESSATDDGFVERRLSYFAKKFNVGISSLVDHLELNEIIIESSPNTKVSEDAYKILLKEFEESSIAISTASSSELISGKSNIKNGKIFSLKSLPTFHIMLKIFKEEHVSDFKILEIGNEKLNNLIRLVVMDNLISDVEKRFLIEKTKELNLPKELAKRAEDYLESNNPFLDRIFELIFSDGIISKVELEFIHEKIIEINLDRKIVNQRFWSYGIHFHLKELQGINDFKNWIVIWYLFANYSSYKDITSLINTEYVFDIFSGTDFNKIIRSKVDIYENEIIEDLEIDISIEEIYKTIFTPKPEVKMDLTETNQLHKDALCWFSINKNKELPLADIEGEKFFRNGSTFLSTRAKGIYKPKTIDFALSIKVLINNPYDDVIQEFGDGSWKIKYHKEDNVDWTNDGLVKCMEYNVPVGLFYQTKERSPSKYKICGLGIINHFDGEYFYINSIKEDDELKFDWNPLDKINNDVKNRVKNVYVINEENMGQLSKIEKEIIELYKDEPFLAMQKFKKFYKSKIKKARQSEINNAFEQLINQL